MSPGRASYLRTFTRRRPLTRQPQVTRPLGYSTARSPLADSPTDLVCFPHSGGAASFFASWTEEVPDGWALYALQYPGRQDRLGDPLPTSMLGLAAAIAAELPRTDRRLVLFGHSFGATLAFEVARLLIIRGREVGHLVASGRPGPALHTQTKKHLLDDDELWTDMIALGGTAVEVQDVPELKPLVVPALRHDYRLIETYRSDPSPLPVPITAFRGADDPEVDSAAAAAWAWSTSAGFSLRTFPGGHFYLIKSPGEVIAALVDVSRPPGHRVPAGQRTTGSVE